MCGAKPKSSDEGRKLKEAFFMIWYNWDLPMKILVQLYFSLFSIEAYYDPLADSEKNLRNSFTKVINFSDRLEWYI